MAAPSIEQQVLRIMSGAARGAGPSLLRGLMSVGEVPYAAAMRLRNVLYSRGLLRSAALPRPVISVGNVTAGGTGKTPMVRWLAEALADLRPAILTRGYREQATGGSDEAQMLQQQLGPTVQVQANRDRFAGAAAVLTRSPDVGLFILDDGFQHRRVRRDFDLVLISAMQPFGYGHVHPRGLLREPLTGLQRADAFVITQANRATVHELSTLERRLRSVCGETPVFQSAHELTDVIDSLDHRAPVDSLRGVPVFGFCGIGNPDGFRSAVASVATVQGFHAYPDHHAYSEADVDFLANEAAKKGAGVVVTTEKDWAKLRRVSNIDRLPVRRLDMRIRFTGLAESQLLELIRSKVQADAA